MFSLIISIIAIALVSALAIASIYYGGEAFNKHLVSIEATKIISQAEQISAGLDIAVVERNSAVKVVADLVTQKYLKTEPSFGDSRWGMFNNDYISTGTPLADDICAAINENADIAVAEVMNSETALFGCNANKLPYYKTGGLPASGAVVIE